MSYNATTRAANIQTARTLETKAGWAIREFCEDIGISIAKFYTLTTDLKPRTVKLCGRVVVLESPREYLVRIESASANTEAK